jgi:glycosyltransferase involved in cell wall biosynthesis
MGGDTRTPARIALVHDFLLDLRGAERVFAVLCDMFPRADLFTAVYDERGTQGRFAGRTIHTTALQRLRLTDRTFRGFLPLYPALMGRLDLSGYDLVVSSHSAWAHGVVPDPGAVHVCYCHNPFRYAWSAREETLAATPLPLRPAFAALLDRWQGWDRGAALRVDRYVANSRTTRGRVASYLGREAAVVAPPVDTARFAPLGRGEEAGPDYVVLSELMPHKHIEVAVEAFSRMGLPLLVVGKGPDARRLARLAGPSVRLVGRLADHEVARVLARARALVVTATEEFGIAAIEAQAAGRPVIALRAGGVAETVVDGVTGCFYDERTPESLAAAVRAFDATAVDPADCVASAARFTVGRFTTEMRAQIRLAVAGRPPRSAGRVPAAAAA